MVGRRRSRLPFAHALALALIPLAVALAPGRARADAGDQAAEIGLALVYITPIGCSLYAGGANTAYWLVDEGAPARFRHTGYVCGGASIAVGAWVFAFAGGLESGTGFAIGAVPVLTGVGAIVTGLLAGPPRDLIYGAPAQKSGGLSPWTPPGGGAGLAWSGTF